MSRNFDLTQADGHAERRRAALDMIHRHSHASPRRLTLGTEKSHEAFGFVSELRHAACRPETEILSDRQTRLKSANAKGVMCVLETRIRRPISPRGWRIEQHKTRLKNRPVAAAERVEKRQGTGPQRSRSPRSERKTKDRGAMPEAFQTLRNRARSDCKLRPKGPAAQPICCAPRRGGAGAHCADCPA